MTASAAPAAPPEGRKPPSHPVWRFIAPLYRAHHGEFAPLGALLRETGDVFCVQVATQRVVFVNDPNLVEELLVGNHKCYHKDPGFAALRRLMGNGLLTSEGEFHLRQRRMIQPAFHKKRIDEYAACMAAFARKRAAMWQDGATLDISAEMMAVTLEIVGKTLFDADVEGDIAAVHDAVELLQRVSDRYVNPAVGRIFDLLPIESVRRTKAALRDLDAIIYRFIREHRESGEDRGDLLSMLMLARDEDGQEGMSDQQLRDESITLFLAGHETTSLAMTWTWYLLSQNPECEARLHEEIDRVLGDGRAPTAGDVAELPYARRVFTESMRLFPPAFGFGRQAIAPNLLGPYSIRKGDIVIVSQYAMGRQEKWYPEPERFDPDRWLPERAGALPKFAYFPFGGGVRKCIGEPFAWMEGILLLAAFAQDWRFDLAPEARIGLEPRITLRPRYGMPMILRRR